MFNWWRWKQSRRKVTAAYEEWRAAWRDLSRQDHGRCFVEYMRLLSIHQTLYPRDNNFTGIKL